MTIRFDFGREDYWNFIKYAIFHVKQVRNVYIRGTLLLLIISGYSILKIGLWFKLSTTYFIIFSIIFLSVIYLLSYALLKYRIFKAFTNKSGVICEHIIEINEYELIKKTNVNEHHYKWSDITHITDKNKYIFFLIGNVEIQAIPTRAFISEDEAVKFYNKTNEYWKNRKY